jgi:hypothetical protein
MGVKFTLKDIWESFTTEEQITMFCEAKANEGSIMWMSTEVTRVEILKIAKNRVAFLIYILIRGRETFTTAEAFVSTIKEQVKAYGC